MGTAPHRRSKHASAASPLAAATASGVAPQSAETALGLAPERRRSATSRWRTSRLAPVYHVYLDVRAGVSARQRVIVHINMIHIDAGLIDIDAVYELRC